MPNSGNPEVAPTVVQPEVASTTPLGVKVARYGLAAVVGVASTLGVIRLTEGESTPAAADAQEAEAIANGTIECIGDNTRATFYANQAPEGSNHFGPSAVEAAFSDKQAANLDLMQRLCDMGDGQADPALMTGLAEYFQVEAFGSPEARDAYMTENMGDNNKWEGNANWLLQEIAKYDASLEQVSGNYYTMYMVRGANDGRPEIRQSHESMTDETVLKLVKKNEDGTETIKRLKLECGFQPVELQEFPGIPHLPEQPQQPEQPARPNQPETPEKPEQPPVTTVPPKIDGPRPTTPGETPGTTVPAPEGPATPDDGSENPVGGPINPDPVDPEPSTPPEEEVPYEEPEEPIEEQPPVPVG